MKSILNLAFLALATTAWHSPTAASGAALPLLDAEEIVFIDAGVEGAGELAGAVRPGIEAVVLDACQDPVAQMARILSARGGLSVVHLVSHGQPGALILNGRVVKAEMLLESDFVDAVNLSLRDAGELRLYGCEVAAGSRGAHFFREIAGALQGRLSASTDRTGNSRLGGDWELEAGAGLAQAGHPFREGFEYRGLLPPVYTVTNPNMSYFTRPGGSNFYWQYGSYAQAIPSPTPITQVRFSSRAAPDSPRGSIQYATSIAGPWTTITIPVGTYSSSISVSGRIFRFVDNLPLDTTSTITGDTSFDYLGGPTFTNAFYAPDNPPTDVYLGTLDYWGTPSATQVLAKMQNTDTGAPYSFGAAYTIDSQSVPNLFDVSGENLVKGSGTLPAVGVGATVTLRYRDYFQLDDNGVPISGQGVTRTVTMTRRENPAGFGNDLKANTFTANAQTNSQVAGLSDGTYVVIWRSAAQGSDTGTNGGIYAQKYTSAGVASGGEFAISPAGIDKNESNPAIAALSNGRFVVVYQQANANPDAIFRIVEANGTLGAEISASSVTTGNQTPPAVTTLSDGNFAITWIGPNGADTADVWVRKFDASTGAGVSGSELVVSAQTGNQSVPGVAGLSDGNYAVSWRDPAGSGDAYCRVMGASAAVSSQISVNVGTSSMTNPRIAALTGGGFVIVYSEAARTEGAFTDNSSQSNIYGKRYNNAGTLQGTEFLVNGGIVSNQTTPAISRLSGGGFVVAWQSNTDPDDSFGVFGRRFDASANPVDSYDFQLNQQRTGVQNLASLGGLSQNNSFATAWSDNALDTGDASTGVGTRLFTGNVSVGDTTPPTFDVAPATANISTSGFDLSASIDEGGTIFYVVVADAGTAPTSAQVVAGQNGSGTAALASGSLAVATTPFSHTFTVSTLSAGTAYDVYVVARDDEVTPNLQATPTKVDVSTMAAAPTVTTATQSAVAATSATLGGNVTADGGDTVTERGIVWGTATGPTTANNKVANGSGTGIFSATVTGLPAGTTVFVRAYAINSVNTSYGSEISFTTLSNNADLSALSTTAGSITFSAATTAYGVNVSNATTTTTVTATRAQANAALEIRINGGGYTTLTSAVASSALNLNVGANPIDVRVTAQDGVTQKTYTITVTRASPPDTTPPFPLSVNRQPQTTHVVSGASTVFRVTFSESVTGVDTTDFSLLKVGTVTGTVASISGSGAVYDVTVNGISGFGTLRLDLKHSGTGIVDGASNGLTDGYDNGQVVRVGTTFPIGWGSHVVGQIGDGTTAGGTKAFPTAVDTSGVLNGKNIVQMASGANWTLVLTADNQLYAWGNNNVGQLGTATASLALSNVPVAVPMTGVLSGKTIVKIACGDAFNMVLDSDGKLYAWGVGTSGQLGDGLSTTGFAPVAVSTSTGLSGKVVTDMSGGNAFAIACTSDGGISFTPGAIQAMDAWAMAPRQAT